MFICLEGKGSAWTAVGLSLELVGSWGGKDKRMATRQAADLTRLFIIKELAANMKNVDCFGRCPSRGKRERKCAGVSGLLTLEHLNDIRFPRLFPCICIPPYSILDPPASHPNVTSRGFLVTGYADVRLLRCPGRVQEPVRRH